MLFASLAIVAGLALIVWGADRFVLGASALARNLGIPPLIVGLTIVGFGTSAPEIFVSTVAAWHGKPGLSIGNAIGSNIANMGLVLGATAIVSPLYVRSHTVGRQLLLMVAITILAGVLLFDDELSRVDGVILLAGFVVVLGSTIVMGLRARGGDPLQAEFTQELPISLSTGKAIFWLLVGLVLLVLSSRLIVWGGISIAKSLNVSDLLIGLTIVAIGTGLPELAASITSTVKGEPDIAIGNVIGSNMFNLLPVLALPGLISPGEFSAEVLRRDFPVMLALSVALVLMAYGFRGTRCIGRWQGGSLLTAFCAYQSYLYYSAT